MLFAEATVSDHDNRLIVEIGPVKHDRGDCALLDDLA